MKWKPSESFDYTQWHRWFAWHPVELVDKRVAWLEYVERKFNGYFDWDYRALERQ